MRKILTSIGLVLFVACTITLMTVNINNNDKLIIAFNSRIDSLSLQNLYLKKENADILSGISKSQEMELLTFSPNSQKILVHLTKNESNLLCIYIGEIYCNSCLFDLCSYIKSLPSELKDRILILTKINTKEKLLTIKDIFGTTYKYIELQNENMYVENTEFPEKDLRVHIFLYKRGSKKPTCVNPIFASLTSYNLNYFKIIQKHLTNK